MSSDSPDDSVSGWLIERKAGPFGMKSYPARWWIGGAEPLTSEDCWTPESNNAVRFCRASDANVALMALRWRDGARTPVEMAKFNKRVTITEHIWYGAVVRHEAPEPNGPDEFDKWSANPYTKVLQDSIARDYVPRSAIPDDLGIREALARLVALSDNGGGSRAQWERAMEAARAALAGISK